MKVTCPICESKSKVATSKSMSKSIRECYCQCLNLNCGAIFLVHVIAQKVIKTTGEKPSPELQPELCARPKPMKTQGVTV